MSIITNYIATMQCNTTKHYPLAGNIIPHEWYNRFTNKRGTPDLALISVLSEITYWYRPKKVKDPKTGQVSYVNKFLGDAWQTSYEHFERKFSFNREKIRRILVKLETMSIAAREFRNVALRGQTYSNRLFIHLGKDFLKSFIGDISVTEHSNIDPNNSKTSFSVPQFEGGYPQIGGELYIDKNKKNIFKDRSMNETSKEVSSSNFLKISSFKKEERKESIPNTQNAEEKKEARVAELSTINTSVKNLIHRIKPVKNPNISFFTKPKQLADLYPLNEEDCNKLQKLSGRSFNLNVMNEILQDMSKRLTDRYFKSKNAFLSYMSKCLSYEMRDEFKVNNETFRIRANMGQEELQEQDINRFLGEIETQAIRQVCPENQLKARIAGGALPSMDAYNLLNGCSIKVVESEESREVQLITRYKPSVPDHQRQIISSHVHSIYGSHRKQLKFSINSAYETKKQKQADNKNKSEELPQGIWGEIRGLLIRHLGQDGSAIDRSWFSKLEAEVNEETKEIKLKAPSRFVRDWVRDKYTDITSKVTKDLGFEVKEIGLCEVYC